MTPSNGRTKEEEEEEEALLLLPLLLCSPREAKEREREEERKKVMKARIRQFFPRRFKAIHKLSNIVESPPMVCSSFGRHIGSRDVWEGRDSP